jgi:hypothetical protein
MYCCVLLNKKVNNGEIISLKTVRNNRLKIVPLELFSYRSVQYFQLGIKYLAVFSLIDIAYYSVLSGCRMDEKRQTGKISKPIISRGYYNESLQNSFASWIISVR